MNYLESMLTLQLAVDDFNYELIQIRRQRRRVIVDQCLEVVKRFEDCAPYDNSCTNVFMSADNELIIRDVLAA